LWSNTNVASEVWQVSPPENDRVAMDVSLCAEVSTFDALVVYEDTHLHRVLDGNPLVHGEFNMRFYAGQPLITEDGLYLGKFCLVDHRPRFLASEQREWLSDFAQIALDHLLTHRHRQ
jgi:GAF domain-containing protein